jgi:hypothetical protein
MCRGVIPSCSISHKKDGRAGFPSSGSSGSSGSSSTCGTRSTSQEQIVCLQATAWQLSLATLSTLLAGCLLIIYSPHGQHWLRPLPSAAAPPPPCVLRRLQRARESSHPATAAPTGGQSGIRIQVCHAGACCSISSSPVRWTTRVSFMQVGDWRGTGFAVGRQQLGAKRACNPVVPVILWSKACMHVFSVGKERLSSRLARHACHHVLA